jgi:hypothetical protein
VSESKKNLGPNDPAYYAPPRSRERIGDAASSERDRKALPVSRGLDEQLAHLRATKSNNSLPSAQSDVFADAVARMLREQLHNGLPDAPSVLKRRSSARLAAKLAVAVVSAAVVAFAYVVFFSPPQDASEDRLWSVLHSWPSTKPGSSTNLTQRRTSALVVRNHVGVVNEPLQLGVSVDTPDTGAIVTIKGMPPGARLSAGVPLSFTEWRVPAEEISNVMVIPPADFVGELELSAELLSPEGAPQVASFTQLVWKAAPGAVLTTSSAVPASARPAPQPLQPAPLPQQASPLPQQQSPPPPQQRIAALPPASAPAPQQQPRADTVHELSANEVAALIRRAQEMLANGDVKAARLALLRAAEAHDARAALALAKTFDPIASRQFSMADPEPDLTQARNWYQKAREWGAPEAQRQLDALASYR